MFAIRFPNLQEMPREELLKHLEEIGISRERLGNLVKSIRPEKKKEPKIGNNEKCPCGSGKKSKKCCRYLLYFNRITQYF